MPVTVEKVNGFRVSTPSQVHAKSTTKKKAEAQANLLRAVEHGWKPTGKPARKKKRHNPQAQIPLEIPITQTPTGNIQVIKGTRLKYGGEKKKVQGSTVRQDR